MPHITNENQIVIGFIKEQKIRTVNKIIDLILLWHEILDKRIIQASTAIVIMEYPKLLIRPKISLVLSPTGISDKATTIAKHRESPT